MSSLPAVKTPKYKLKLPSTGETVEYRPFLMAEEKILLIALESKKVDEIVMALRQIIEACTFNKLDVGKLPNFDLEYVFLQLRAKSVNNIIEFEIPSEDGETRIQLKINIDDIQVVKTPGHTNIVELGDSDSGTGKVGCTMRYPVFEDIHNYVEITNKNTLGMEIIKDCIVNVFDNDTVVEIDDTFSDEELDAWLGTLGKEAYEKITKFFETQPVLKHTIKYQDGGAEKELVLEGLESFFTLG